MTISQPQRSGFSPATSRLNRQPCSHGPSYRQLVVREPHVRAVLARAAYPLPECNGVHLSHASVFVCLLCDNMHAASGQWCASVQGSTRQHVRIVPTHMYDVQQTMNQRCSSHHPGIHNLPNLPLSACSDVHARASVTLATVIPYQQSDTEN